MAVCPQTVHHRSLTLDRPGSVENEAVVFFMFYYAGLNVTMMEHVPQGNISLGGVIHLVYHCTIWPSTIWTCPFGSSTIGTCPIGPSTIATCIIGLRTTGTCTIGTCIIGLRTTGTCTIGTCIIGLRTTGTCTAIGSILLYIMYVHDVLSQVVVSTDKAALDRFYLV